ncbi:site-specific DNA-methyltransferase [Bradyrhizobium sp. JYMT SZCCT0428]|nr:site-specific DNA-methyltransferase [Bradyrhizobium sp. JYMT SZCCT0428]
MLADIMRDCTKRGQLVIDSFIGSESTLIGAEETERACVGVELDPYYIDVTIRRWQAITGRDAIHLGTGHELNNGLRRRRRRLQRPPKSGQFKPGKSGNSSQRSLAYRPLYERL